MTKMVEIAEERRESVGDIESMMPSSVLLPTMRRESERRERELVRERKRESTREGESKK